MNQCEVCDLLCGESTRCRVHSQPVMIPRRPLGQGGRSTKYKRALRELVLKAYGGRCRCCGEREESFLTIDHVNNDGAAHRKEVGANGFYAWLKRNGFPAAGFQILCRNCNWGRAVSPDGMCPHERRKREGLAAARMITRGS